MTWKRALPEGYVIWPGHKSCVIRPNGTRSVPGCMSTRSVGTIGVEQTYGDRSPKTLRVRSRVRRGAWIRSVDLNQGCKASRSRGASSSSRVWTERKARQSGRVRSQRSVLQPSSGALSFSTPESPRAVKSVRAATPSPAATNCETADMLLQR